eukprot:3937652-Rhodomonas_salina.1
MVDLVDWGPFEGTFGPCKDDSQKYGCSFHGAIMEELSWRACVIYKDSWTYGHSTNAGSYKDWMLWVAANYDVGIGPATETADRLADHLVWSAYLTDNSFVLATRKAIEPKNVLANLFQFLTPFSWQVWVLLILGGFLSSVLYVATERRVNTDDLPPGTALTQIGDAFMLACFQFTGAGGFTPRTAAGRVITFSWGFTTLLTVAATLLASASRPLTKPT